MGGSHWSLGCPAFPSCSELHFCFFSTPAISSACFEMSFTRFAGSKSVSMSSAFEAAPGPAGSAANSGLCFSNLSVLSPRNALFAGEGLSVLSVVLPNLLSSCSPLFPARCSFRQLVVRLVSCPCSSALGHSVPPLLSFCTPPSASRLPTTVPAVPAPVPGLSH